MAASMRKSAALLGLVCALSAAPSARADSATSAGAATGALATLRDGGQIYAHVCQGCHMRDGRGGLGAGAAIPALAGNGKLEDASYPAYIVLHGEGGMPDLDTMLTDTQVAAVVNYVRTHFGNHAPDQIDAATVHDIR